MTNLLRFEFRKLFRSKSLYICAAVAMVVGVLGVIIMYYSYDILLGDFNGLSTMPTAWETACNMTSSPLPMLMAILTSILICSEHSCGAIKNVISRGYTRDMVCVSQIAMTLTILAVQYIAAFLATLIASSIYFDFGVVDIAPVLAQLCALSGYVGLYFMIASLIRKTGGVIAVNIFVIQVVGLVFTIIDVAIYFARGAQEIFYITDMYVTSNYWLSGLLTRAGASSGGIGDVFFAGAALAGEYEYLAVAGIGMAYAALFFGLGYLASRRRDV